MKKPVYISAGLDEKMARRHPDWLMRDKDEKTNWAPDFMHPGYHQFCMNTPYLDYLIKQIEESIHRINPGMRIFHNGGHIRRGRRDLAAMNTHLELESLPTGGWGYDHFPLSARYVQNLGMDYLGMTGKFHTTWGEFGGYKHPNALRYEAALSIANGARCSIGDQLHPQGLMDEATYSLIGAAYKEVEEKEAWCTGTANIADVALLSLEAAGAFTPGEALEGRTGKTDAGAVRMLLEGKILFDIIDAKEDLNKYKVVILPDRVRVDGKLKDKLDHYFKNGGKVLATGESGLDGEGGSFAIDLGVKWLGVNPFKPDYFRPHFEMKSLKNAAFIFYSQGQKIALDGGVELGHREDPYFNRDIFTFCSHQHTPSSMNYAGPGMVESGNGIYFAWNVFEDYAAKGSLALKEAVLYALNRLLPGKTLETDLPAQGIVTLARQKEQQRFINHLLYASPVKRGDSIEVIEDILPLYDVNVTVRIPYKVKKVYLAPQMQEIAFDQDGEQVSYTISRLECHQMVVLDY